MIKTNLYIPGDNEKFIWNIGKLDAGMYTLDLEDSIHVDNKVKARNYIKDLKFDSNVYVRVNNISSGLTYEDLICVVNPRIKGVCYPKCESVDELKKIEYWMTYYEKLSGVETYSKKIQLLVENAFTFVNLDKLIAKSKRVNTLVFGIMDFCNDMNISIDNRRLRIVRELMPIYARSYGMEAIDCPFSNIKDVQNFICDTVYSKSLGYDGRIVIHPNQIEFANQIYTACDEEIKEAKEIVCVYEEGLKNGLASVSYNGQMIAYAMYVNAKKIVENEK